MHFLHHLQKVWILFKFGYLKKSKRLDFIRHTFAVHALESMVDKGIDTYVSIPYLEEYMGHRNIKCTEKYLRLTAESYDRIIDALAPLYNDMFKGGDADE